MKNALLLLLLSITLLNSYAQKPQRGRNGTTQKEATAPTQPKQPSAYAQDQINRKKAMLNFKMVFVEGGSFTMGCTPEQTVMVGDQIFTDTWGAHNSGVTPLLVKPIRLAGNPGRYIRYAGETPFRLIGAGRAFV